MSGTRPLHRSQPGRISIRTRPALPHRCAFHSTLIPWRSHPTLTTGLSPDLSPPRSRHAWPASYWTVLPDVPPPPLTWHMDTEQLQVNSSFPCTPPPIPAPLPEFLGTVSLPLQPAGLSPQSLSVFPTASGLVQALTIAHLHGHSTLLCK